MRNSLFLTILVLVTLTEFGTVLALDQSAASKPIPGTRIPNGRYTKKATIVALQQRSGKPKTPTRRPYVQTPKAPRVTTRRPYEKTDAEIETVKSLVDAPTPNFERLDMVSTIKRPMSVDEILKNRSTVNRSKRATQNVNE